MPCAVDPEAADPFWSLGERSFKASYIWWRTHSWVPAHANLAVRNGDIRLACAHTCLRAAILPLCQNWGMRSGGPWFPRSLGGITPRVLTPMPLPVGCMSGTYLDSVQTVLITMLTV